MDGDQAERFEKLEEQLRRLENVVLSDSKPSEGEREENLRLSERSADLTGLLVASTVAGKPDERIEQELPGTASIGSARNISDKLAQASLSRQILCCESGSQLDPPIEQHTSRATAQLNVLEAQAIRECRKRIGELAQDAVGETLRRLRSLGDDLLPLLHADMQKSLERSADVLVRRAEQSIERQIQIAAGRRVDTALQRMKSAVARAAGETAITQENSGSIEEGGNGQGEMVRTLVPVVEEIQIKSAAFFDDLHSLLQNTFRAFEEKATKQIGEEFQKIGEELLRREVGRHLAPREAAERPDGEIQPLRRGLAIEEQKVPFEGAARARPQPIGFWADGSAEPSGIQKPREIYQERSQRPASEKPHTNAPKWRILGLGGQLFSAVFALLGLCH